MKKTFSIFFALVLVLSFSLVTAAPVAASVAYEPRVGWWQSANPLSGTAEYSTTPVHSADYSAHLEAFVAYSTNDYHEVYVANPTGVDSLADLNNVSLWYYCPTGDNAVAPLIDVWLDMDGTYSREFPPAGDEEWLLGMLADVTVFDEWVEVTLEDINWVRATGGTVYGTGSVGLTAALTDLTDRPILAIGVETGGPGTYISGRTYDMDFYVDDIAINGVTYAMDPRVINTTQTTGYVTIQEAIDAALPNDTITVAVGTYNLVAPIAVTESVTITGDVATPSNVVIDASGISGDDRDCFQVKASDVTIQGFTIQGALDAPGTATGTQNSGIVIGAWWAGAAIPGLQNITIRDNDIAGNSKGISVYRAQHIEISYNEIHHNLTSDVRPGSWPGKGIMLYGDGPSDGVQNNDIDILWNEIYSNGLFGIELNHWETTPNTWINVDVLIKRNEIYNNGMAWDDVGYAIDCGRGISANGHETGVAIMLNEIYGHWSTSGARFASSAAGIRLNDSKGFQVYRNDVHDNMRGIYIYGDDTTFGDENTGFSVTFNDVHDNAQGIVFGNGNVGYAIGNGIYGNEVATYEKDGVSPYGAVNLDAGNFHATNNWWGHSSGPGGEGNGSGDTVSVAVDFEPWLLVKDGDTYDKTLALNPGWSIVSPADELTSWDVVDSVGLVLAYDNGAFAEVVELDAITPVFIKTADGGGVGFTYATDSMGMFSTQLEAGWNLIGVPATFADSYAVLSPLRYGANNEVALATLASQGQYNLSGLASFYRAMLSDDDWADLPSLDACDGYWAYMNVAKEFGVVVIAAIPEPPQ